MPDAQVMEPYQLERNEIRTQNMKHRRVALAKLFAKRGVITPDEAAKLFSEDVGALVELDGEITDILVREASSMPTKRSMGQPRVRYLRRTSRPVSSTISTSTSRSKP